jgi:hypothetical protein
VGLVVLVLLLAEEASAGSAMTVLLQEKRWCSSCWCYLLLLAEEASAGSAMTVLLQEKQWCLLC